MKRVILVAGMDYEFKGVNFRIFCDNRMKRLLAANKAKEEMTFQIFDIRKGEIVTHEVTYPGGKQTDKVTTDGSFGSLSKANYDATVVGTETHYKFKEDQRGILSILDIYKAVQTIGSTAANTLVELSFFSHAWMGGPILVNSFDDGLVHFTVPMPIIGAQRMAFGLPSGMRDPDDLDPRSSKDFISPTMDATDLANFKKAFNSDGFIWIWGCAFPRLVHEVLHKIEKNAAYKESGLGDDAMFKFTDLSATQADFLEKWLKAELGLFPDKKKIEIKFKFLKFFICKIIVSSYTHHIAKNAGIKAFGGVMGTYSEYDTGKLPLMSVHSGFSKHFTFYKNYMGFAFDPEGRHYGEYKPGFTCTTPTIP